MANDWIGNPHLLKNGILSGELSFYAISKEELEGINQETLNQVVIPPVNDVISCHYFPYMSYNGLSTEDVQLDTKAYPLPNGDGTESTSMTLHRIKNIGTNSISDVGRFNKYCVENTTIGGEWRWQNEGKLWLPPFTTCIAFDGLSEPIEINPTLFKNDLDTFAISVRHSLNHLGAYTLYIEGYRGSSNGSLFGSTVTGLSFPIMSNTYTEYMHANQFAIKNQRWQSFIGSSFGVVGSAMSGNVSGMINGVSSGFGVHSQLKAQENQAKLSGYQLTGDGSNALHDLQISPTGMKVAHLQYQPEEMERIGSFFHAYGYTQNKMMQPEIKSRKNFNYIKTNGVNLKVEGIPKDHLNKLKRMFDNGVTLWHMDTENNFIGNYAPDNVER